MSNSIPSKHRENGTIHLLVIDDEDSIQEAIRLGLSGELWSVVAARSGEEGLRCLEQQKFQCVLLDLGLPHLTGIETLKRIRSKSKIPLLILTVEDDDQMKVTALESGADDYVTKPFSFDVLRARIKAVIRRVGAGPFDDRNSKQKIQHLTLDAVTRKVWVSGHLIHLTSTEYELLLLFFENQGRVVTHREILNRIWGNQAGDQMHYLRVYVRSLRKKIEINPSIPQLILTEPGVGYRMNGTED